MTTTEDWTEREQDAGRAADAGDLLASRLRMRGLLADAGVVRALVEHLGAEMTARRRLAGVSDEPTTHEIGDDDEEAPPPPKASGAKRGRPRKDSSPPADAQQSLGSESGVSSTAPSPVDTAPDQRPPAVGPALVEVPAPVTVAVG